MTAWTPLLDRLEERLRRISETGTGAGGSIDVGPPPTAADRPAEQPTDAELLRLHALHAAQERLEQRLLARRTQLQQAERYHLQTGH